MENDIFMAGVRPGSPTSHDEIKILLCTILSQVDQSMLFSQLHEALQENNLVNYFALVQAMEELVATGHVTADRTVEPERYSVTELGRQVVEEFERRLPAAVREKALSAAKLQLQREKREMEVDVRIDKEERGYTMRFAIPEINGELVSFSLFVPTREECDRMRRHFLNDPLYIYHSVLALLTGDQHVLGEALPTREPPLF